MRLLSACFSWFMTWQYRWPAIALAAVVIIVACRPGCNHHPAKTAAVITTKVAPAHPMTAYKAAKKVELKKATKHWAKRTLNGKVVSPVGMTGKAIPPKMPLGPTGRGPLTGLVVVIDPGHGGTDCGAPWSERFSKTGPTVQFLESSYTYKMAWELSNLVRKDGGTIYLTAYSRMMDASQPSSQISLAEPSDARYLIGGDVVTASDMKPRTEMANFALNHKGKAKAVVFIAVHINSAYIVTKTGKVEKNNQRGSFVVVREPKEAPQLALTIGKAMRAAHYFRLIKKHGKWVPATNITEQRIRLWVLRDDKNFVPQKLLVEFAEPSMNNESWRMRTAASRKVMLERCIIRGLAQYLCVSVKKSKR